MDAQDQTKHTSSSGHKGHHGEAVLLCHRCGWPYHNPHPSAKHRRAHKNICGTIEGYPNLIGSQVVSDDEHHPDDDKEQTPSPKIDKKLSIDRGDGDGEIRGSFTRSEDEVFADAVTEFADSGSAHKTLEKDLFLSFKDAENSGTNEVVNAPIEISKVDTSLKVSEKTDLHLQKIEETEIKTAGDSSEPNLELTRTNGLVKDGAEPQETKSIYVARAEEEKGQESQISETITEEAKDSEITNTIPGEEIKQESIEKLEPVTADGIGEDIKQEIKTDCEHVSEAVKESETVEEIKIEKLESDHGITPEVVKESKTDHNHAPEVAKESEIEQTVSILNEKADLGAPNEQIQEVIKEPVAVLTEKRDLEATELEKISSEQIQETVKEPVTVLIEKEDLGVPQLEKQSIEHTHEVVKKPNSILTESVVVEPDSDLTAKEDLGAHKSEKCSEDEVADVSTETITLKESSDNLVINSKNASVVVPEPVAEEGNGKLINNQDSGADLTVDSSSVNSLEGTWGSVSVLSTASIDAETTEKSKVNSEKSNAATSDDFEPPSFMTLVKPESKDNKCGSSEVKDSQPQPNSEASQAGWFPTLTNVNNESEGRKKNEEVMAKVTSLGSGKHSTPLKNLLGEARSPSGKKPEPVVQKDEATINPPVNDDVSSPPKLIEDGKKGKKGKGRSSWVPFVCCSSVNAVK